MGKTSPMGWRGNHGKRLRAAIIAQVSAPPTKIYGVLEKLTLSAPLLKLAMLRATACGPSLA